MELDKYVSFLNTVYIQNLITYGEKNNINTDHLTNNLELSVSESEKSEVSEKNLEFSEKNLEFSEKNLEFSEEYLYKKTWTKLSKIHKIIKIKEFINNLNIEKENIKNNLEKELTKLVKNNILTKKNMVNYDQNNSKIISIPNLSYKSGKYIIQV